MANELFTQKSVIFHSTNLDDHYGHYMGIGFGMMEIGHELVVMQVMNEGYDHLITTHFFQLICHDLTFRTMG
jgi:hypothetical protein